MKPSRAIIRLAVPATLALLAKAIYNITDTAYIGMLKDETALAAVGVTLPLLLIFVSIENIFAAGAGVLAGRQLGSDDKEGANTTVSTIVGVSMIIGIALCVLGIIFMEPLLRSFGASDKVLPLAKQYAFWMFIAAIANLPAQSLNCAARAESSVRISSIAVIVGAALNVVLDPIFMFPFGFNLGVAGASIATTLSQFVTAIILFAYYFGGKSIIKLHAKYIKPTTALFRTVIATGIPTAVVQICLAASTSLTNMAAAGLPQSDLIIAAYGVVQRLVLVGAYIILGFMQGYQPVAAYSFGARNRERFLESERFALKGTILLSALVEVTYILLSRPLIMLFNQNPAVVGYGSSLLISQVAIYPAFGICYLMTIIFQSIGATKFGVFLSTLRQGLLYIPFILVLPHILGLKGIYLTQPVADVLTLAVSLISYPAIKRIAVRNMASAEPASSVAA
jgi:putative MATE family efflux protein